MNVKEHAVQYLLKGLCYTVCMNVHNMRVDNNELLKSLITHLPLVTKPPAAVILSCSPSSSALWSKVKRRA